jgi:hypothetical protein
VRFDLEFEYPCDALDEDCIMQDSDRVEKRLRQIEFHGKGTKGYQNYLQAVPKHDRQVGNPHHPVTPRAQANNSKRRFDLLISAWRIALHTWDDDLTTTTCSDHETQHNTSSGGAEEALATPEALAEALARRRKEQQQRLLDNSSGAHPTWAEAGILLPFSEVERVHHQHATARSRSNSGPRDGLLPPAAAATVACCGASPDAAGGVIEDEEEGECSPPPVEHTLQGDELRGVYGTSVERSFDDAATMPATEARKGLRESSLLASQQGNGEVVASSCPRARSSPPTVKGIHASMEEDQEACASRAGVAARVAAFTQLLQDALLDIQRQTDSPRATQ